MSLFSRVYTILRSQFPIKQKSEENFDTFSSTHCDDSGFSFHEDEKGKKKQSFKYGKREKNKELAECYAMLEIPFGSDKQTARKALRSLLKKYHPDRHAHSSEKQKMATTISMELTRAYQIIEETEQNNR